ncbi:folylpolyglutamate synthase [Spiroplasma chinense]|uniref:Folylpolyglutamate synthase n=1 Tax=Spiroplasma chinense TaxID=216932 RepID=A0A5B9Y4W6_9MOLU|nr:Mur ligase family protein [Spiroplasma chinense]QEH61297.1 folylpolyglutamate synthase [Spiroplasma chinense]
MISVNGELVKTKVQFAKEYNLKKLLEEKGNPQNNFKVINVVGTNGKGSTSNYIYQNLLLNNKKAGMFFSPAFIFQNERIQVNGNFIGDNDLKELLEKNNSLFEKYNLTFFEIWTYIAIEYFNQNKIEYAVVEAGIGGRRDSTNCFENQIAVCLTSIGFDHTEILGDTIEKIVWNKLGIVKGNSKIYTTEKNKKYEKEFLQNTNNEIVFCENTSDFGFQKYNKSIAKKLIKDLNLKFSENIKAPLGRNTVLKSDPIWVMDGCHNLDGATELANSVKDIDTYTMLFASSTGREKNEMINFLESKVKNFYVTEFEHPKAWNINDVEHKNKVYNWKEFLEKNKDTKLIICGSLYFIPQVYEWFEELK